MSDLFRLRRFAAPAALHNVSPYRLPGPTPEDLREHFSRTILGARYFRRRPRITPEEGLRARIPIEYTRGGKPWKVFKPARWYPADWEDDTQRAVVLRDGRTTAVWPAGEVEIRAAADDEWEIRSAARMDVALEGQMMQIPGRVAECPEGHARSIPTRFDAEVVVLKCAVCGRAYRLVSTST